MRVLYLLVTLIFFVTTISAVKTTGSSNLSPVINSCQHDSRNNMVFLKGTFQSDKGLNIKLNDKRVKTRYSIWGNNEIKIKEMTIFDLPVESVGESIVMSYSNGQKSNECVFESILNGAALPSTNGGLATLYGTFYYNPQIKTPIIKFDDTECKFVSGDSKEINCMMPPGNGCYTKMKIGNIGGFNINNELERTNCYRDPFIEKFEIDSTNNKRATIYGYNFWQEPTIILTIEENCMQHFSKDCSFGREITPSKITMPNDSTLICDFEEPLENISFVDIKYKKFNADDDHQTTSTELIEHRRYF